VTARSDAPRLTERGTRRFDDTFAVPVDYGRQDVAEGYGQGRALGDDVLARWRNAVDPFLPDRPTLCVLDVGAGTGIFSRAWPKWHPCTVIALEPSPAMRAEMVRNPVEPGITVTAGRCEQLPLRKACVDVAWLSTVIHHFDDLDRCV
jgi:ubiquinone/menaquinone biosynthesis C-methylase UbiE